MKNILAGLLVAIIFSLSSSSIALAHCEIPCGIYDDPMRIKLIAEHIATIEKSMNKIKEIEEEKNHEANQLVRWVNNKEDHANQLQEIVTQYFMTQRIKPDMKNYDQQLSLLHQILLSAMKSKQTTDGIHVAKLKKLLGEFETLYFSPH
jgi:nickel superoxide dismutase